jgi:hypothetical protein
LIVRIGNVALIVIDPLTAYVCNTDSHVSAEVRQLMAPVGTLAAEHDVAIVCVSHFNKGGGVGAEAVLRITGSLDFSAAVRGSYAVVKDKDDERRRLFLPIKNNIAEDMTGLAFRVESAVIQGKDINIGTSRVEWEAELCTINVNDAMAPEDGREGAYARNEAEEFLRVELADGPVSSTGIRQAATGAGHSWRTVERAKQTLGVRSSRRLNAWYWELNTANTATSFNAAKGGGVDQSSEKRQDSQGGGIKSTGGLGGLAPEEEVEI